jgi:hypothetical protein
MRVAWEASAKRAEGAMRVAWEASAKRQAMSHRTKGASATNVPCFHAERRGLPFRARFPCHLHTLNRSAARSAPKTPRRG